MTDLLVGGVNLMLYIRSTGPEYVLIYPRSFLFLRGKYVGVVRGAASPSG